LLLNYCATNKIKIRIARESLQMVNKKTRVDSIQGQIQITKSALLGRDLDWPEVVDLPVNPVLRDKSLKIFSECISTRERDGFNSFERIQAATLALVTASYLVEMIELEREGNLIPNPTNPKYQNRNPRLDVVQSLSATRGTLAKALKLFSTDDSRVISSRKRAFDYSQNALSRSSRTSSNDYHDLLA